MWNALAKVEETRDLIMLWITYIYIYIVVGLYSNMQFLSCCKSFKGYYSEEDLFIL